MLRKELGGCPSSFAPRTADAHRMTVELPWADFRASRLLRFGLPLVATALALIAIRVTTDAEPSVSRWIAIAAASGFGAIAATIIVLRATSRRFEVFKTGFRYTTAEATVLASWDQVESFYTPSVRFRRFLGRPEYRLVTSEQVLSIGSQVGADVELGRWIEARTKNSAIARAQAKVAAGIPATFGPIRLHSGGIEIRARRTLNIPFARIRDQRLSGSRYTLTSMDRRRPYVIPVAKIPNVTALYALIEPLRGPETTPGPISQENIRAARKPDGALV